MAPQVIALDVGHSAVKAAVSANGDTHRFFMPSVVCPAFPISDEAEARMAERETVSISQGPGGSYFFGETALTQGGGSVSGLSDHWIATREHKALLLGAMKKVAQLVPEMKRPDLVMGLPARLYAAQRDGLAKMAAECFPDVGSIRIVSQASGPLFNIMLAPDGMVSREHAVDESWGVVEVGYYTSDFMMTRNGRWAEDAADGCSGVHKAAEHIKRLMADRQITMSLTEAEQVLQTGFVKHFGKRLDVTGEVAESVALLVSEVVDTANRLMEDYARQLDGVLIAGGGAPLVFDQIRAQWPHAIMLDNPRFAVAEGMRRYGLARAYKRQADNAAKLAA